MTTEEFYQQLLEIRPPWSVSKVELDKSKNRVDVWLSHDEGCQFCCPCCQQQRPVYDHIQQRSWRHLDSCQYETYLHARLPRVSCGDGVHQINAPWAEGRSRFSLLMEAHCLRVLQECDIQGVYRLAGIEWHALWRLMELAVARGLRRKERKCPIFMGIDEKSFAKGHKYETLVCDLERGTVEWVGDNRRQETLEAYLNQFSQKERAEIQAVAIDMWDPYIAALKATIPKAEEKIVFDRFHVTGQVTKAVDQVRKIEHRTLLQEGDESLKQTKYLWLRNADAIPQSRKREFSELKRRDLKVGRAWSIKESLRHLWSYSKPGWAERYFRRWYFWATHSRLPPVIKAARTLKRYSWGILNYFKNRITNALAESLNAKIETIKKMACGYRNRDHYKTAIYFHCGGLDIWPRGEWGPEG